jgi:hypothetical protein
VRLRRGMSYADREKLRHEVAARLLRQAQARLAVYGFSPQCIRAFGFVGDDPVKAQEAHNSCLAEQPGGRGCLCPHHDLPGSPVTSGFGREEKPAEIG